MGRKKTNLKKKIAAKKQQAAMHTMAYRKRMILKQCIKDFANMLKKDETKKQEAYRWN